MEEEAAADNDDDDKVAEALDDDSLIVDARLPMNAGHQLPTAAGSATRFCRILGAYEHASSSSSSSISSSSSSGTTIATSHYYISMRLEQGDRKGIVSKLTYPGRLAFFTRLIEALELLHSVGIQHRDLKEGNLAIRPVEAEKDGADPIPVILDFGSALLPDMHKDRFVGVGTPGYFPPESVRLHLQQDKVASSSFNQVSSLLQYILCMGPLGIDRSDLDWLSSGGMGIPADVFAAAIIGISIFSSISNPAMHYCLDCFGDGRPEPSTASCTL